MIEVDEHSGMVVINIADHGRDGDCEGDRHTPDAARDLAAELLAAADHAEPIFAAQLALCATGHDWGLPYNSHDKGEDATVRLCQRETCRKRGVEPGWIPFAGQGRTHDVFGTPVRCSGPGCEVCGYIELGEAIRPRLEKALRDLQPPVLGPTFDKAKLTVEVYP